jgi:hypothetical protein
MGRRQPITTHRRRPFITATERLAHRGQPAGACLDTPFQIADNVVLNADESVRFLEAVPGLRNRAALTIAYGAGLALARWPGWRPPPSTAAAC